MRLRTKIITVVAAVMAISLLILFLSVMTLSLEYERTRRFEIKELLKTELPFLYRTMGESEFIEYLRKSPVLSEWYFSRGNNIIQQSSSINSMDLNRMYITVDLDRKDPPAKLSFLIQGSRIIQQSYVTFFATWLICMLLMAGILYLTLSRLVIKPIEVVIEASSQAARGDKPGMNPIPNRMDEAGVMVRGFYGLLNEIYEYRTHLEEKVRKASREIEKTHEKLIVSQRLSATGKLAAGIAHEINNPLGGMLNAVSSLKKHDDPEKKREYIGLVEECINRIGNLVKELLAFVRVEQEFSEVDLAQSVDFAHRMVRHYLDDRQIAFHADIEDNSIVSGNPGQIQQMLLNLFLNSIHSITDKGKGEITVKAVTPSGSDTVKLTVEDNGCGIPRENLDSVFDLFYTSREDNEGTGLGLSIVHSIVTGHKGSVSITSDEGKGTVVTVTLPKMKGST